MKEHSDKILNSLVPLVFDRQSIRLSELSQKLKLEPERVRGYLSQLIEAGFPIELSNDVVTRLKQHQFLDAHTLFQGLDPSVQPSIDSLDVLPCVDSTNEFLLRQTHNDCWKIAVAEYQTRGRGRRGRNWQSQFGDGICMSLARQVPKERLVPLSLVAGVSVATTLRSLGGEEIGLKWPNDVVARDYKLGGILTESQSTSSGIIAVIGLGLNYRFSRRPDELSEYGVIDLLELCNPVSRSWVCCQLLNTLLTDMTQYLDVGFGPFRDSWAAMDAFAGRHVSIKENETYCDGIADGIDSSGAFRLRTDSGVRCFLAGDVSLRLRP